MRFAKKFSALAAVICGMAFAAQASAFVAPTNITPYLPQFNVVTVTKIKSTVPGVDLYSCSSGCTLSVAAGTPVAKVVNLGSSNLAFSKFKVATLTPAQRVNPIQVQQAQIWFLNKIGRPYYGL